jgi:hypothetical protein
VVRRGLSPVNAVRPQTTALILGAGGIARAGIYGLIQLGVRHIFISNRTLSHAENLARHYNEAAVESLQNSRDLESAISSTSRTTVHVIESMCDPWPEGFRQPTIIVSCIPAHSIGGAPAANITLPDQWFKSPTGGVVIDVSTIILPASIPRTLTTPTDGLQTASHTFTQAGARRGA